MIKKILGVISIVILILSLSISPLTARAGGGGSSGGGGGGSGGSSSSGSSSHSHGSSNRSSDADDKVRLIGFSGLSLVMVVYGVHYRRSKAKKMHREAKKQLELLDDSDEFWSEKRIKKEVENCYYAIQMAWSNQDIEALQDYLTPSLLEAWKTKLNWQEYQGQKNVLSKIRLLNQGVVEVYDSENDDEDYFWVYIEGKMDDRIVNSENKIIERNKGVFVEYWKFQRRENNIYLDKVYQKDEFES